MLFLIKGHLSGVWMRETVCVIRSQIHDSTCCWHYTNWNAKLLLSIYIFNYIITTWMRFWPNNQTAIISSPVLFCMCFAFFLFFDQREKKLFSCSWAASLISLVSRCLCSPSQSEGLSLVPGLPLSLCTLHKDSLTKARGTKTQEWEPIKGIIGAACTVAMVLPVMVVVVVMVGGEIWRERRDGKRRRMEKPGRGRKKARRRIETVGKASGAKLDGLGEETVN